MATQVKHRRGNSAEIAAKVPAVGEFWFNTDDNSIHVGNGVKLGGFKIPNTEYDDAKHIVTFEDEAGMIAGVSLSGSQVKHAEGNTYVIGATVYRCNTDQTPAPGIGSFTNLTEVEPKNLEQDNRIAVVEAKDTEQDGRLDAVETKNVEQDNRLTAVENGQSSDTVAYATQALLFADLNHPENTVGKVLLDPTPANNGNYLKVGASGAGSWSQSGSDLASQAYQLATENEALLAASNQDVELVTGTDSDMSGANNWIVAIGSPVINIAAGKMNIQFPSGTNAAIKLADKMVVGEKYELRVKVELVSGSSDIVQIGSEFSGTSIANEKSTLTKPVIGEVYEIYQELTASNVDLFIGVNATDNNGSTIAVSSIELRKVDVSSRELIERIDDTSIHVSGNMLDSYSSLVKYPNKWVQDLGVPTINYNTGDDSFSLAIEAGENNNIRINDIVEIGEDYVVKLTCRILSGSASPVVVGNFSSSPAGNDTFTPTSDFVEYTLYFNALVDYLSIGTTSVGNLGQVIEVKDIRLSKAAGAGSLEGRVDNIDRELVTGNILNDNDETMTAPTSWEPQIGSPVLDYTSNPGALTVDYGISINRSIQIVKPPLVVGQSYDIEVDLKVVAGVASKTTLGLFSSGQSEGNTVVTPTTEWATYKFSIVAEADYFGIGIAAANNLGTTLAIDNVVIKDRERRLSEVEHRLDEVEAGGAGGAPTQTLGADSFMSSLSRYDKPLIKFCVAGDSLMGNYYGGAIPPALDEGVGYRPIRLDINSVPRRIYDHVAFNKAEHRRLDVVEWTLSGAWGTVNDSSVWEPAHPDTLYHTTSAPNAYAEIVIPDGVENFALICQRDQGFGTLDITLNGGDPSAYGPASVDLDRTRVSAADRGNPYHTVQYLGLPAGANTIRVAKQNDSTECRVWGGFHWSGTTLVLHNISHGGHSLQMLIDQHLDAEMLENDFDAILFEITIMNEMSKGRSPEQTVQDLRTIISTYAPGKDQMYMTPNPFGDNGAGTNYYTLYSDPDMEDTSDACVKELKSLGVSYVNCFDMFKKKIENRGGTLVGGEGGLYYTTDGQHPNADGAREWFNLVRPHLSNKPYNEE